METSRRCTLNHPPGQGLTNSIQSQAPNFARQNQRHNRRQNLAQHGYDDDYSHPFRVAAEAQHSLFQENDKQYGENINAEVAICRALADEVGAIEDVIPELRGILFASDGRNHDGSDNSGCFDDGASCSNADELSSRDFKRLGSLKMPGELAIFIDTLQTNNKTDSSPRRFSPRLAKTICNVLDTCEGSFGGGGDPLHCQLASAVMRLHQRLAAAQQDAFDCGVLLERCCVREAAQLRRGHLLAAAAAAGPRALMTLLIQNPEDLFLQERGWRSVGDLLAGGNETQVPALSGLSSPHSTENNSKDVDYGSGGGAAAESFGRFGACELVVPTMQRFGVLPLQATDAASVQAMISSFSTSPPFPFVHHRHQYEEDYQYGDATDGESKDGLDDCDFTSYQYAHNSGRDETYNCGNSLDNNEVEDANYYGEQSSGNSTEATIRALQGWCCRAIYLMAWDSISNHERLGSSGACEAVIMTLRNYSEDMEG